MPDDAPQTGQRVWRDPLTGEYRAGDYAVAYGRTQEPGVWHPTDPKALAEMREHLRNTIYRCTYERPSETYLTSLMHSIGLTPPEPKECSVSGIEGVALRRSTDDELFFWALPGEETTHRAFPEPVALLLVAVAEAAQHLMVCPFEPATCEGPLRAALDALAEAQAGAA